MIAEHLGVSNTFIGNVRRELSTDDSCSDDTSGQSRVGKDGKRRKSRRRGKPKPRPDIIVELRKCVKTMLSHKRNWQRQHGVRVDVRADKGELDTLVSDFEQLAEWANGVARELLAVDQHEPDDGSSVEPAGEPAELCTR